MGMVFGGYTDISWTSKWGYKNGNCNSFVFSLRDDFKFVKLKCFNKSYEVYNGKDSLACFGSNASGFCIVDDCNINTNSIS